MVTKNPTPAPSDGKPSERSLLSQEDVSKPGKCHPWRSPKNPPSFIIPRTLSGYLYAKLRKKTHVEVTKISLLEVPANFSLHLPSREVTGVQLETRNTS